jgi:hypothetical protein
MHNEVRQVKHGFVKATKPSPHEGTAEAGSFNSGVGHDLHKNIDAARTSAWAKKNQLDIDFNMVALGPMREWRPLEHGEAHWARRRAPPAVLPHGAHGPLLDGRTNPHALCDMIGNATPRGACPFQNQGIMLNPDGGLFFWRTARSRNVVTDDARSVFRATSQNRDWVRDEQCPSC